MSAFARLVGSQEPKLPVWPMITDMTRVMDGELTMQQLAEIHSLTAEEVTEVGEYLTAIGSMVTTRATALVAAGIAVGDASEVARSVVNAKMMHALLRSEQGTHTEASFRSVFGLNP